MRFFDNLESLIGRGFIALGTYRCRMIAFGKCTGWLSRHADGSWLSVVRGLRFEA